MNKLINFIKYHNAFNIILGLVLFATAGAFANTDVRNAVIGQKLENVQGIDNAQLLAADLNNFDLGLKIINITEDANNYYVNYVYQTLAIKDNVWQPVIGNKTLTVSKAALGNKDLGLFVQEELSEVADYQIGYLKRVQTDEKVNGATKLTASIDYTGLIGIVLDIKDKVLPGYKPVITKEICDGEDNNRNGLVDEDLGQICCGAGACAVCLDGCQNGVLQICTPGAPVPEVCGDGIDNNCNGIVDDPEICEIKPLIEEPPACQPTEEICDGIDNNCDGQVDEGDVCVPPFEPEPEPQPQPPEPPQNENPPIIPEPILNPPAEPTSTTTEATTTEATTTEATTTEATTTPETATSTEPIEQPPLPVVVPEEEGLETATTTGQ